VQSPYWPTVVPVCRPDARAVRWGTVCRLYRRRRTCGPLRAGPCAAASPAPCV